MLTIQNYICAVLWVWQTWGCSARMLCCYCSVKFGIWLNSETFSPESREKSEDKTPREQRWYWAKEWAVPCPAAHPSPSLSHFPLHSSRTHEDTVTHQEQEEGKSQLNLVQRSTVKAVTGDVAGTCTTRVSFFNVSSIWCTFPCIPSPVKWLL